jgi:murein L,D-transpeptidase YafK
VGMRTRGTFAMNQTGIKLGIALVAVPFLLILSSSCRFSADSSDKLTPITGNMEIVVSKSERKLRVYADHILVRTYPVGLGFNPGPDKIRQGDGATPEGEFFIFTKNEESKYYLSLGVSYPNLEDAKRGLASGLITQDQYGQIEQAIRNGAKPPQDTALGGEIYIHGRGAGRDWTWGCIALDDEDMKELFETAQRGTKVTIRP